MDNNDVLRRMRFIFDFNDTKMMELFALGGFQVTRAQVSDWLKKEEDLAYQPIEDYMLAAYLNGFIVDKRGKRDGEEPKPEKRLNNNLVFKKLKIGLGLKDEDILEILGKVNMKISKHELSAFFRKPDQPQYRRCEDQILRNFFQGMLLKYQNKQ